VLPPTDPAATYRARIFTPEAELPFAGHPSLGAAVTLMRRGAFETSQVVQECGAGLLPISVHPTGRATLTGGAPRVGEPLDPAPLLASVGLTEADFIGPAPRVAGCGLAFPFLSVTEAAVVRAAGDAQVARRAGIAEVTVFHWDAQARQAHTRVFCPGLGVPEDPATGSSALGFGVWLVKTGLLPGDGESGYTVVQGLELHRPSTLECTVSAVAGMAVQATVSGHVVPIARGEIAVPPFVG
jgi:trans-2,3-dihydro-3-hydroxyanthranilate isomerase